MDTELLITLIESWGKKRGLHTADPSKQLEKLLEEVEELKVALETGNDEEITDALGDIFVVLVQLATQTGRKIEHCIEHAWGQIKNRRGRIIDGKFVKEENLIKMGLPLEAE